VCPVVFFVCVVFLGLPIFSDLDAQPDVIDVAACRAQTHTPSARSSSALPEPENESAVADDVAKEVVERNLKKAEAKKLAEMIAAKTRPLHQRVSSLQAESDSSKKKLRDAEKVTGELRKNLKDAKKAAANAKATSDAKATAERTVTELRQSLEDSEKNVGTFIIMVLGLLLIVALVMLRGKVKADDEDKAQKLAAKAEAKAARKLAVDAEAEAKKNAKAASDAEKLKAEAENCAADAKKLAAEAKATSDAKRLAVAEAKATSDAKKLKAEAEELKAEAVKDKAAAEAEAKELAERLAEAKAEAEKLKAAAEAEAEAKELAERLAKAKAEAEKLKAAAEAEAKELAERLAEAKAEAEKLKAAAEAKATSDAKRLAVAEAKAKIAAERALLHEALETHKGKDDSRDSKTDASPTGIKRTDATTSISSDGSRYTNWVLPTPLWKTP
jgi:hypothetical protein